MTDWNAAQYLLFERERTRPARDLLAACPLNHVTQAVDLGCGPGNSTRLLVEQFPKARVTGVDTSADMLSRARADVPEAQFVEGDAAQWRPDAPVDLIFANALLQWVPDHARLLPRLMGGLAPGGVLAVQMPDNLDEPSHALMREVVGRMPFADKLAEAADARTVLPPMNTYYEWLRPHAGAVDLWRTTYVHALAGPPAIIEWLRSTGLRPFLDPLEADEKQAFLHAYEEALEEAYPRQSDGMSLLRFPRLFIVAVK